jgi:hypothetical protein
MQVRRQGRSIGLRVNFRPREGFIGMTAGLAELGLLAAFPNNLAVRGLANNATKSQPGFVAILPGLLPSLPAPPASPQSLCPFSHPPLHQPPHLILPPNPSHLLLTLLLHCPRTKTEGHTGGQFFHTRRRISGQLFWRSRSNLGPVSNF